MTFQQSAYTLFTQQMQLWPQMCRNFEALQHVQTRVFEFAHCVVRVQHNPARIISSGAKLDARSVAARRCFLCATHRKSEQLGVDWGDYTLLVNPFPIFPHHFTLPYREHRPQCIAPYFTDMLQAARALPEFVVFYNGPECGASAPDHMHFQVGDRDFLPLLTDYQRLRDTCRCLDSGNDYAVRLMDREHYLRAVVAIEAATVEAVIEAFERLYHALPCHGVEPMMNIVCAYANDRWCVFVIPRGAFRPRQYYLTGDAQLLISPATVEMSGVFIAPIEEHFLRITQDDVVDILAQVGYNGILV